MKYEVDVKAHISVVVEADNEADARIAAEAFVEEHLVATEESCRGWNDQLPDDTIGEVVPGYYFPAVDGISEVEEALP